MTTRTKTLDKVYCKGMSTNQSSELYSSGRKMTTIKEKPKFNKNGRWVDDLITKEELEYLYVELKWPIQRIAKQKGVWSSSIKRRLFFYGIKVRNCNEQNKIPRPKRNSTNCKVNPDELRKHISDGLNLGQIAKIFDVHPHTIRNTLKRNGMWNDYKRVLGCSFERHKYPQMSKRHNHIIRSHWEEIVADILNNHGIIYKYEPFKIKTKYGTYTPDFVFDDIIIEVKGYHRSNFNDDRYIHKLEEAMSIKSNYQFWILCREDVYVPVSIFDRCYFMFNMFGHEKNKDMRRLENDLEDIKDNKNNPQGNQTNDVRHRSKRQSQLLLSEWIT